MPEGYKVRIENSNMNINFLSTFIIFVCIHIHDGVTFNCLFVIFKYLLTCIENLLRNLTNLLLWFSIGQAQMEFLLLAISCNHKNVIFFVLDTVGFFE